MYRCQLCGEVAPPRARSYTIIVETRERVYPFRTNVQREEGLPATRHKHKDHWDDPGGAGREIVRELRVCASCKAEHHARPT
jgi:hypothetical protein